MKTGANYNVKEEESLCILKLIMPIPGYLKDDY